MNETIKTILNRRSVRSYLSEQIKTEELDAIIKAGLYAPSAKNEQSWHLTVVQNKDLINELSTASKAEMLKQDDEHAKNLALNENYTLFYNAPTIIVISGKKTATAAIIDCSAATENMLIAAESLNIGTCWIGLITYLFKSENAKEYINKLSIPEGYEPYYAITMGYKGTGLSHANPRSENTVNYI